jgi:hypothetical protein
MSGRDTKAVDVLATIRRHAASHLSLAGSDAYSAQEAPKLVGAALAVAELIEAAGDGTPEAGDRAVSYGLWFGPNRAERLRNALARVQGKSS